MAARQVLLTTADAPFGEELRKKRVTAGISLTQLSRVTFYSKGFLSKVERGLQPASGELARICDTALGADGQLAALASGAGGHAAGARGTRPREEMAAGRGKVSRRRLMETGLLIIPASQIREAPKTGQIDDSMLTGIFRPLFDQYRRIGQAANAALLLPALSAQAQAVRELAQGAGPRTRRDLLQLAARYAEYAGWLAQEAGRDDLALHWTQQAGDLATAGGDPEFARYGLVRHALVTLYRGEWMRTIELARQAQDGVTSPRVLGLAAQREAQGHALGGDYGSCMRSLDRAQALLAIDPGDASRPVTGTSAVANPAALARGWCLYDLGRPKAAAEALDRELATLPQEAARSRTRFGVRRALAYAATGEVDHACHLTTGLLDSGFGSATIGKELRRVAQALQRHPKNPSVRDLSPRLWTALGTSIP
jgi:transcriptional regulator with XRE-family HTH domain